MTSPLDGLRVVDLSQTLSGALATHFLADNGAEVIVIEPPAGSAVRELPASALLLGGKKSVQLDVHDDADRDQLRRLIETADVFVESYRPGVADALGLGAETLAAANPGLVHLSITGWGTQGPNVGLKGYEHLVLAKLGFLHQMSRVAPRPGPAYVSVPYASVGAAHTGVVGMLAALLERERSGVGQHVESNLAQGFATLDVWAWWMTVLAMRYPDAFKPVEMFSEDNRPLGHFVFQNPLCPTSDGHWLLFGLNLPHMLKAGMHHMGLDDVFTDPATTGFPHIEADEVRLRTWERLLEGIRAKSLAEWDAIFEREADLFAEEARHGASVLGHPQLRHGDATIVVDDRGGGSVRQPGPIVRYPDDPHAPERGAPTVGQHTEEVLAQRPASGVAEAPSDAAAGEAPLAGVTVLELGALFAGPYAATVLADLGARIIKVEPPDGDPVRTMLPFPELGGAKVMQGKESVVADITTEEGLRIVHELAARADVVLQSYRPDAAARLRIDATAIKAVNPDAVYLSALSYGLDGPDVNRPAFATTIGAAVGIARANVGELPDVDQSTPLEEVKDLSVRLQTAGSTMNANTDGLSALGSAMAMLVGLVGKARQGKAANMLTTMLTSSVYAVTNHIVGDATSVTPDEDLFGLSARYRLYETSDGWVFLAAPKASEWDRLADALATHVELAGDARFSDEESRREHDDALAATLAGVFGTRSAVEWERDLTDADVGCVEVATEVPEALLMSEEFGGVSGYITEAVHPTFDEHPRLTPAVRFSRSAGRVAGGVLAGDHTDAVLRELGYDDARIADLRDRDIVR